jgi:pimeloyl-ACP methyl ester carboxylesterase
VTRLADSSSPRRLIAPLVLLHGFAGTWRVWKPVIPALERHHDVLALRLPGHFESPPFRPKGPPSIESLTDAVEDELDSAGLESPHLAGNSLGAWIAFELARCGTARSVLAISPAGGWRRGSWAERRIIAYRRLSHPAVRCVSDRPRLLRSRRVRRVLLSWAVRDPERPPGRLSARLSAAGVQNADPAPRAVSEVPPRGFEVSDRPLARA